MNSEPDYWSQFYGTQAPPLLPSQFAAFVANELVTGQFPDVSCIVDLGCGNGRDSFFFLQFQRQVISVDASATAIAQCNEQLSSREELERTRGQFLAGRADDATTWEQIAANCTGPALIYARFFFHAIDDASQAKVLGYAANLLGEQGGALCVEARNQLDRQSQKETPDHYRRFIVADEFVAALKQRGLRILYRSEGLGMAKYRHDDANVFRVVAGP